VGTPHDLPAKQRQESIYVTIIPLTSLRVMSIGEVRSMVLVGKAEVGIFCNPINNIIEMQFFPNLTPAVTVDSGHQLLRNVVRLSGVCYGSGSASSIMPRFMT
jgi:hypothetical protein